MQRLLQEAPAAPVHRAPLARQDIPPAAHAAPAARQLDRRRLLHDAGPSLRVPLSPRRPGRPAAARVRYEAGLAGAAPPAAADLPAPGEHLIGAEPLQRGLVQAGLALARELIYNGC